MDAYGYILKGNATSVRPDYVPSLIGIDAGTFTSSNRDPYFERVEITDRTITSLAVSRWITFGDSATPTTIDPILEVKAPGTAYYIPRSELYEIAAFHHDDDTIEMIDTLAKSRRPA